MATKKVGFDNGARGVLIDLVREVMTTQSVAGYTKEVVELAVKMDYVAPSSVRKGKWIARPAGREAIASRAYLDMAAMHTQAERDLK